MLSPVSTEEDPGLGAFIIVIIICTGGGLGEGIGLLMNLDLAVLSLIYTHFTVTPAKLGWPPPHQFFSCHTDQAQHFVCDGSLTSTK